MNSLATRECSRCHAVLPLTEYHSRAGRCRQCKRELDSGRIRHPKERPQCNWGELAKARKRRWQNAHKDPLKDRARQLVRRAIIAGRLVRPSTCSVCGLSAIRVDGVSAIQAHHHNGYEHPLDVEWLCVKCHRKADDAARAVHPSAETLTQSEQTTGGRKP